MKKMKKIHNLFPIALSLLAFVFLILPSCDKMNDIQQKYAQREEQVYLGKVDSLKYFSGFGGVKLTWYISSDPRIDRTIIYWNMRHDSIVKKFDRTGPGIQKDSITIRNLPEGSDFFEFRNVDDEGESSLYSSSTITVWGPKFASSLLARRLTEFDFNYSQSLYNLALTPVSQGDSVAYSQIVYTNKNGEEKTVRIDRDVDNVALADFPDGGEFRFRTVFFPPQGIDTVYNEYTTFKAPQAVSDRGTKISFAGNMDSKYFAGKGDNLYEWNANGDLILYTLSVGGSLTQTETFPSILPLSDYFNFFYYGDDRFIGVSPYDDDNDMHNDLTMYQIVDGNLEPIENPDGETVFGTWFDGVKIIPVIENGYFYTIEDNDQGQMKTWFAHDDATWGTPNGNQVGTGFAIYDPNPIVVFNRKTILGVDADGYLWSTPISVNGVPGSKTQIGAGWNRFKRIVSIGTTLLCMEDNGDFYVFENFNTTDKYWIVN